MAPRRFFTAAALSAVFVFGAAVALPRYSRAQEAVGTGSRPIKLKVAPAYPELAKQMHIGGAVKVEVTIAPNGTVKHTRVLGGHPLLAGAAEDALKRWKYEPAGSETTSVVEIRFAPGA